MAYIKDWLTALNDNPKMIFKAANDASGVFEALVDFSEAQQPKLPWFPDKSTWPHLQAQVKIEEDDDSSPCP